MHASSEILAHNQNENRRLTKGSAIHCSRREATPHSDGCHLERESSGRAVQRCGSPRTGGENSPGYCSSLQVPSAAAAPPGCPMPLAGCLFGQQHCDLFTAEPMKNQYIPSSGLGNFPICPLLSNVAHQISTRHQLGLSLARVMYSRKILQGLPWSYAIKKEEGM